MGDLEFDGFLLASRNFTVIDDVALLASELLPGELSGGGLEVLAKFVTHTFEVGFKCIGLNIESVDANHSKSQNSSDKKKLEHVKASREEKNHVGELKLK